MHIKDCIKYLTIALVLPLAVIAQDPQVSQFYAAPVFTNPAMAGAARKLRVAATARNQYTALNNNYKTAILVQIFIYLKLTVGLGY